MMIGARARAAEGSPPSVRSRPLAPAEVRARHEAFMWVALAEARRAEAAGEVPVGAVVVQDGVIVGRGHNRPIGAHDPTAHAEVEALRAAARAVGNYRLPGVTLYVTMEPCVMCAGACLHARVGAVVFGAADDKAGALVSRARILDEPIWNHRVAVAGGVLEAEARERLQAFFRLRRGEGYRSGRNGLDSKSSWG